jgi:acyl-CoA synthetase
MQDPPVVLKPTTMSTIDMRICCWARKFGGPVRANGGLCSEHCHTEQTEASNISLRIKWKLNLGKCIDASPLLVTYRTGESMFQSFVFIGSHSHNFACIEWESGLPKWVISLPDRVESSAAISRFGARLIALVSSPCRCGMFVIVGCYDGGLYFIRVDDGSIHAVFATADAIKCSPCVDYADGTVYCGSHDGFFSAIRIAQTGASALWQLSIATTISQSQIPSAIFSSPCITPSGSGIVCATLSGIIVCCRTQSEHPQVLWSVSLPGSIFSSPSFIGGTERFAIGCTNGSLYIIAEGVIEHAVAVGAPIFAQPAVLITDDDIVIAFASHAKALTVLDGRTFAVRSSVELGCEVTSSVLPMPASPSPLVVCPCTSGDIAVVCGPRVLLRLALPGQVFSSPTLFGVGFAIGCRDDHVYCIAMDSAE